VPEVENTGFSIGTSAISEAVLAVLTLEVDWSEDTNARNISRNMTSGEGRNGNALILRHSMVLSVSWRDQRAEMEGRGEEARNHENLEAP